MKALPRSLLCVFICVGYLFLSQPYNGPAARELDLLSLYNVTESGLGVAFSGFSIASAPMALLGGILVDRMGVDASLVSCSLVVVLAQAIGLLSTNYLRSLPTFAVSRVLFAVGFCPLFVAQSAALAQSFAEGLPLAMGLYSASGRLGDIVSFSGLPRLPFWLSRWFCTIISSTIVFVLAIATVVVRRMTVKTTSSTCSIQDEGITGYRVLDNPSSLNVLSLPKPKSSSVKTWLLSVQKLGAKFWLLEGIIGIELGCMYALILYYPEYLNTLYGLDQTKSTFLATLVPIVALIASPLLGAFLSKFTRLRGIILTFCSLLLVVCFVLFGFTTDRAGMICAIVLSGFCYGGLTACVWPCLVAVSTDETVGFAFGVGGCTSSLVLIGLTYAIGFTLELGQAGILTTITLGSTALLALFCCILYTILDGRAATPRGKIEDVSA